MPGGFRQRRARLERRVPQPEASLDVIEAPGDGIGEREPDDLARTAPAAPDTI